MPIPAKYFKIIAVWTFEEDSNPFITAEQLSKKVCEICNCTSLDLAEALWIDQNHWEQNGFERTKRED